MRNVKIKCLLQCLLAACLATNVFAQNTVVGVEVSSSKWTDAFYQNFELSGNGFGHNITQSNTKVLPWVELDTFTLFFSKSLPSNIPDGTVMLKGRNVLNYTTPNSFQVTKIGSKILQLKLNKGIDTDRITLETSASFGSLALNVGVLPTDVNQDGVSNGIDLNRYIAHYGSSFGEPKYLMFTDYDGNGMCDLQGDLQVFLKYIFSRGLPN